MPDLLELMDLYARRGIDDWKNAPDELRRRARDCLGTAMAESEHDARISIYTPYNGNAVGPHKFIPMPHHRHAGIDRCFFLPICEHVDGQLRTAFDLFLLVKETKCLAFRFEPPDQPGWSHNYVHVQLSQKLLRKTIRPVGIPNWLPEHYPAFPVPSSDPLKMFLSVATAVHGYYGGIESVLLDIFQKDSRTPAAREFVDTLRAMLN